MLNVYRYDMALWRLHAISCARPEPTQNIDSPERSTMQQAISFDIFTPSFHNFAIVSRERNASLKGVRCVIRTCRTTHARYDLIDK